MRYCHHFLSVVLSLVVVCKPVTFQASSLKPLDQMKLISALYDLLSHTELYRLFHYNRPLNFVFLFKRYPVWQGACCVCCDRTRIRWITKQDSTENVWRWIYLFEEEIENSQLRRSFEVEICHLKNIYWIFNVDLFYILWFPPPLKLTVTIYLYVKYCKCRLNILI